MSKRTLIERIEEAATWYAARPPYHHHYQAAVEMNARFGMKIEESTLAIAMAAQKRRAS